jgi:hypothetical protein
MAQSISRVKWYRASPGRQPSLQGNQAEKNANTASKRRNKFPEQIAHSSQDLHRQKLEIDQHK